MPVVNSGRIAAQGMALLSEEVGVRRKSIGCFKDILDFAGYLKARVGLGAARGPGIPGAGKEEMEQLAEQVFRELAEHAEKAGVTIMLEASEHEFTGLANTNEEAMMWVERISSPSFSVMLDTHQLWATESSVEHGIKVTKGKAKHIHLYEPSRWPPGVLPEKETLDWPQSSLPDYGPLDPMPAVGTSPARTWAKTSTTGISGTRRETAERITGASARSPSGSRSAANVRRPGLAIPNRSRHAAVAVAVCW